MMVAVQLVLLAVALVFTSDVISLLAPGFRDDPGRFALATELTRITFPYLLLVSLVTLYGGILNSIHHFATPAAAPILLNLSMMATLALAAFFPSAGHAAAWGVFIAGILELLLVVGDAGRAQVLAWFSWPRIDENVRKFFRALGPATVGSAGVQLAMFADTIIASFLAAGAISALYYADRINQLPIGVIGIAIGTVLLPEMSRRLAAGDEPGARHAQNRAIELTLLLTIPCLVAFLLIPDLIMRALFLRGKFTADDALAAGATLAAYAIGLIPYVLIRSMTAPFFARGDTATPVKASLIAVAINILIKIALMGPLAQVGLAIATAIGAWVNLGLVTWFASRAGIAAMDARLKSSIVLLTASGCVFGIVIFMSSRAVTALYRDLPTFRDEASLATLALFGGIVYAALIVLLLGRNWFGAFRGEKQLPAVQPTPD